MLGPFILGPNDESQGIYTGDVRDLLPQVPDDSAALMFCDPPYWVGFRYGTGKTDDEFDYVEPEWIVAEGLRVASCVLITPGILSFYRYPPADWIYGWFKPGSTRRSAVLNGFNTWEPVLVYGKPVKNVWQDSSYLPSVSNLNDKSANFHGCPKPVNLLIELVDKFTYPGDTVIDPMIGSGTTAIAAKKLRRRWLGFEIDPEFVERARERVRLTQPPLFTVDAEQPRLL